MTEAAIITYVRQRMRARGIRYLTNLADAAGLDKGSNSFKSTRRIVQPQTLPMLRTCYLGPIIAIAEQLGVTPGTLVDEMYAAALKHKPQRD